MTRLKNTGLLLLGLALSSLVAAQVTPKTRVQGNTEINVSTKNMTAVATGENNVAKNRVGVIQGDKRGDMRINVSTSNITTVASGRNKKACTTIGGVTNEECK